ncbi:cyclic nucleotide-binding protein [Sphingopyxis sp. H050]|uniref:Crp/Fnr family transcriptional regulator n=1 Tax=Sphingopyxis sp. H050 TaxID=1759072 RepID=UPI00073743C9|nr:cyclic nucleotide-binding domain-containing protein [Sphingopyxis sp. H050]KTE19078.1 cyclic nucleotide-binding protein [Sphingopyxis sp. H050]
MANFDPAWFGYGALMVLLAASLVVRVDHVRLGLAIAALLALPVAIFGWSGPGYTLLILAILLVNLGLITRLWLAKAKVSFNAEERELRDRHFERLSPANARALIDQGHWISAKRGEVLIRENEAAPCLFYLAQGTASIHRDGADVGALADGALIGEATVLDETHATGTVLLTSNSRLWFIPAAGLRAYLAAHPEVAGALHEGFARAMRGKLASANARIAERPPLS